MKTLKYILIVTFFALFTSACNDGIDDITKVDPGADLTAPIIKVIYPTEGVAIKVYEEVTSLEIKTEVTDDIEILEISMLMDGVEIAKFNSFKDYRIALENYTYDSLTNGEHKLTVIATDIEGKTTTKEVNFSKEPPYTPQFDGETLYMPFDGNYMDLIGFNLANEIGTPGFSGTGYAGSDSYKGATDSYLTMPIENILSNEFSAAFWYKVNANPDRAGLLVVGDNADDRNQGFRLFREGNGTEQRIKLNVGTGAGESWNDGGVIDVAAGEWVHVAFTISQTKSTIYFNGIEVNSADLPNGIDWTGCDLMTIGAGGDTFSYWNHKSDLSDMDELRLFDKALTQTEIQIMINAFNPYIPLYDGESFYMPFDGNYINLVGSTIATAVGSPEFTDNSFEGSGAYLGAADSYLTHPAGNLLSNQFSAAFWYKVNASPDRAGILVIGNDTPENRNQGFRLFREGNGTEQRIKLNVGVGTGESWNDGDVIDVTAGEWVHVAITISNTQNKIYLNGVEVRASDMAAPIDWTGCESFTIGSGTPTFDYWNHLSDASIIDELRFFNKELSADEVIAIVGGEYKPPYFGATMYLPFDGTNTDKVKNTNAAVVGTPGFAGEAKVGSDAFAGNTDSYLSYPLAGVFNNEFSGAFWYKVDSNPDRAGIITVAPARVDDTDVRTSGFRLFREGSATEQRIKLQVGAGEDVWNDGDVVDVTAGEWVHIAFTVTADATQIYLNGTAVANSGSLTGKTISWEGCTNISIGSGAPGFIGWNHLSDSSFIDEVYFFDKALTQEEIQAIVDAAN